MNTDVNDNHAYLRVTTPTFGPKNQMTFLFQIDSHLSTTSGREEAHTGTHTLALIRFMFLPLRTRYDKRTPLCCSFRGICQFSCRTLAAECCAIQSDVFMRIWKSSEQPWVLGEFSGLQNKQPDVDRQVSDSTSSRLQSEELLRTSSGSKFGRRKRISELIQTTDTLEPFMFYKSLFGCEENRFEALCGQWHWFGTRGNERRSKDPPYVVYAFCTNVVFQEKCSWCWPCFPTLSRCDVFR